MSAGEISAEALAEPWAAGAYVVDVREPFEYESVHIPGAVPIPLGEVAERHEEIPRDQPVFVVCAVGGRSARAAQFLAQLGVDAHNVAGGTDAWVQRGLPVADGSEPGQRPSV